MRRTCEPRSEQGADATTSEPSRGGNSQERPPDYRVVNIALARLPMSLLFLPQGKAQLIADQNFDMD